MSDLLEKPSKVYVRPPRNPRSGGGIVLNVLAHREFGAETTREISHLTLAIQKTCTAMPYAQA